MAESDTDSRRFCGGRAFAGIIATIIFFIAFLLIFIAMVAPDWLAVDDEKKPPSTKFQKLGLWMSCYKLIHDPYYYDPWLTGGYDGCRWIYYPVTVTFNDIREYIIPAFMVPVQVSYCICFIITLICLIMVFVYLSRFSSDDKGLAHYLIVLGMLINMAGLLLIMDPFLNDGSYVFTTVTEAEFNQIEVSKVLSYFKESEGITIILKETDAILHNLSNCSIPHAWITLKLYTSLEAIGITASFSTALARENISCNVVAGFYHDHIFVPKDLGDRAFEIIKNIKL